jgi:glycosyltransferase involved in cell wall biosynthesis
MMSKQEPLVSVVTPVYNGEPYLRECIESVLAQTYTHWDLTIVNNCSTDRTLQIAQEYAASDPRIRVHNNETFVRVIENHNIALRQISCKSKYSKVLAADDWLFPECLEKMIRLAEQHPNVAVVGAYQLSGARVHNVGLAYPNTVVPGREACRIKMLGGSSLFGTPTAVLYRSDIVRSRHAFYNESNLHADAEVCFRILEHHDFGFVHQVLTFRRAREGSLTPLSQSFNMDLASFLLVLVNYGAKYLSDQELKRQIRERLRRYYRYLGEQVYRRRGRDFWNFHRAKLAVVGYPLSRVRLAASAVSYGLGLVLNSKSTAEHVARRLSRVLSRSSG